MRSKDTTRDIPIDIMAINPWLLKTDDTEPNPLDAVQYARLKMLQALYSEYQIQPHAVEKIFDYRFLTAIPVEAEPGQRITPVPDKEIVAIEKMLNEANSLIKGQGFDNAEQQLKELLSKRPNNIAIMNNLLALYVRVPGKEDKASELFETAKYLVESEIEKICLHNSYNEPEFIRYQRILQLRQNLSDLSHNLSVFYSKKFDMLQLDADPEDKQKQRELELLRYRAITYSQLAIDYDPLNFHSLKMHGQNFMRAHRFHTSRVMLEEALHLGYEVGGYYSVRYLDVVINILNHLSEDFRALLKPDKSIPHYEMLKENSIEELVNQLEAETNASTYYSGLWGQMREKSLRSENYLENALLLVQEGKVTTNEEAVFILSIHIPRLPLVNMHKEGKSRKVYKAYKDGEKERPRAVIVYNDEFPPCTLSLLETNETKDLLVSAEEAGIEFLRHDNLVCYYSSGTTQETDRSRRYIEYEFLEGQSLEELSNSPGIIPDRSLLKYYGQAMEAIIYMHSKGFLHRDIKLDNIEVVESSDDAKLTDIQFICRIAQDGFAPTYNVASHRYAAPEILLERARANQQTEVFSFGACLLYSFIREVNTSQAYRLDKYIEVQESKYDTALDSLIEQKIEIDALKPIIRKALSWNPQDRYLSVQEMQQDLRKVQDVLAP